MFQKQLLRGENGFLLNELTAESLIKTFTIDKRFWEFLRATKKCVRLFWAPNVQLN